MKTVKPVVIHGCTIGYAYIPSTTYEKIASVAIEEAIRAQILFPDDTIQFHRVLVAIENYIQELNRSHASFNIIGKVKHRIPMPGQPGQIYLDRPRVDEKAYKEYDERFITVTVPLEAELFIISALTSAVPAIVTPAPPVADLPLKEKVKRLLADRFFRIFPDQPEGYPSDRMQQYGFQPSPMKLVLFKSGETHFSILEDGSWTEPIPTQNDELVIQAIRELEVSAHGH